MLTPTTTTINTNCSFVGFNLDLTGTVRNVLVTPIRAEGEQDNNHHTVLGYTVLLNKSTTVSSSSSSSSSFTTMDSDIMQAVSSSLGTLLRFDRTVSSASEQHEQYRKKTTSTLSRVRRERDQSIVQHRMLSTELVQKEERIAAQQASSATMAKDLDRKEEELVALQGSLDEVKQRHVTVLNTLEKDFKVKYDNVKSVFLAKIEESKKNTAATMTAIVDEMEQVKQDCLAHEQQLLDYTALMDTEKQKWKDTKDQLVRRTVRVVVDCWFVVVVVWVVVVVCVVVLVYVVVFSLLNCLVLFHWCPLCCH